MLVFRTSLWHGWWQAGLWSRRQLSKEHLVVTLNVISTWIRWPIGMIHKELGTWLLNLLLR